MRTSEAIQADIRTISPEIRLAHVRNQAAHQALELARSKAVACLLDHRGGEDVDHVGNNVGNVVAFAQSRQGADLAALESIVALLANDGAVKAAAATLEPLEAELAEALEREQVARKQVVDAEAALADAEAAAASRLAAKIQDDKQVKDARAVLNGIKRLGEPLADLEPARELAADFH